MRRRRRFINVLKYLLRDDFTTDLAAGSVNGTPAEPGPGVRSVVDTTSNISISGGKAIFASGKTPASYNDPYLDCSPVITLKTGNAFIVDIAGLPSNAWLYIGFTYNHAIDLNYHGITLAAQKINIGGYFYTYGTALESFTPATPYQFRIIQWAYGAICEIRGGAFTDWTVLGIMCKKGFATTYAQQYASIHYYSGSAFNINEVSVKKLMGGYALDYGIAVSRVEQPLAGTDAICDPNGFVIYNWTPAAGEVIELDVRRTDADNRWIIRCNQAGSTMKIIKREAGSETEVGSVAATITPGNLYQLFVRMVSASIRAIFQRSTPVTVVYNSATFNQTATGVHVNHDGSELSVWPRKVGTSHPLQLNLSLITPQAYQTFQRIGDGTGTIALAGKSVGLPAETSLDHSFNGGAYSAALTGQAAGQGRVIRRRSGGGLTSSTYVDLVGIGEVFAVAGQSNSTPQATNTQNYSHATLKAGMYGSQGSPIYTDFVNLSVKSWWPKVATDLMATLTLPVGFIPGGWTSTSIANWQKVGGLATPITGYTCYSLLVKRIQDATSSGTPPRCILWWQGETDVGLVTPRATYLAALTQLADDLYADTGCKLMPCKLGNSWGGSAPWLAINGAIGDAWAAGGNILTGPDFSDLVPSSGQHFVSDAEMVTVGGRWATAISAAFGW